ncbi:hypothetical protein ACVB8X_06060 [Streptomyces sp. NRAIS4]
MPTHSEPAARVSSLAAVTPKQDRSGELLFVTGHQEFRQHGRVCLVEEQDIVYRSGYGSAPRHPATLERWRAVPASSSTGRRRLCSCWSWCAGTPPTGGYGRCPTDCTRLLAAAAAASEISSALGPTNSCATSGA